MKNNLIFDVGLHMGEDSEFYLKKGFNVVAVEANDKLCQCTRDRLSKYIEDGTLTIINCAIAEEDGPITFYSNEDRSVWGTISPEWAKRNETLGTRTTETTVRGTRFKHILDQYGIPYYLKIDIEGADTLCLIALKDFKSKPKFVSIESDKTSWKGLLEEFRLLSDLGYKKYKVVQQLDVPHQSPPTPPREGNYTEHQFGNDATGLFGDEAPGPWLSKSKALALYGIIFLKYYLYGDKGKFYILRHHLARLPLVWRLTKHMTLRKEVGWYDTHASQ